MRPPKPAQCVGRSNEIRGISFMLRMNGLPSTFERSRVKRLFTVKIAICAQVVRHT